MEKLMRHASYQKTVMVVMALFVIGLLPVAVSAVEIADGAFMIENAKALDGQTIIFEGEVLEDIMKRQDHYWINVLNQGTAIGVWISQEQRDQIIMTGRYGTRGDIVRIAGIFSRACPEHGGDLDIHAENLTVITSGKTWISPLNRFRLLAAMILSVCASILILTLIRRLRLHSGRSKPGTDQA